MSHLAAPHHPNNRNDDHQKEDEESLDHTIASRKKEAYSDRLAASAIPSDSVIHSSSVSSGDGTGNVRVKEQPAATTSSTISEGPAGKSSAFCFTCIMC